jgi:hypothetical protein
MPVLAYFAVTAPILLAILLAVSAHLEPHKAPSAADFLGIGPANATSQIAPTTPQEPLSEFARLKGLPLER